LRSSTSPNRSSCKRTGRQPWARRDQGLRTRTGVGERAAFRPERGRAQGTCRKYGGHVILIMASVHSTRVLRVTPAALERDTLSVRDAAHRRGSGCARCADAWCAPASATHRERAHRPRAGCKERRCVHAQRPGRARRRSRRRAEKRTIVLRPCVLRRERHCGLLNPPNAHRSSLSAVAQISVAVSEQIFAGKTKIFVGDLISPRPPLPAPCTPSASRSSDSALPLPSGGPSDADGEHARPARAREGGQKETTHDHSRTHAPTHAQHPPVSARAPSSLARKKNASTPAPRRASGGRRAGVCAALTRPHTHSAGGAGSLALARDAGGRATRHGAAACSMRQEQAIGADRRAAIQKGLVTAGVLSLVGPSTAFADLPQV